MSDIFDHEADAQDRCDDGTNINTGRVDRLPVGHENVPHTASTRRQTEGLREFFTHVENKHGIY